MQKNRIFNIEHSISSEIKTEFHIAMKYEPPQLIKLDLVNINGACGSGSSDQQCMSDGGIASECSSQGSTAAIHS